ncbi:MAG TPA: hypothetical protein VFY71_01075 [Planctomycetota bacterium]|nr:hypothetical protein [Planctomycetota bacterium]
MLKSLRRCALPAVLLLLAGSAAAQNTTLNDTWFKLKIKVKGQTAVPDAEDPHKVTLSETAYLHLSVAPIDSTPADGDAFPVYTTTNYAFELWTETAPDVWSPTYTSTEDLETASATDFFFSDFFMTVNFQDGAVADNYMTIAITAKLDKEGAFKSAKFKSMGGETYQGTVEGNDALRGGITVTGNTVAVEKLPFEIP